MAEATKTESSDEVITQCVCQINKKEYTVTVTNTHLTWHVAGSKEQKDLHRIRVEDVIVPKLQSSSKPSSELDCVHVRFVKEGKKLHLQLCSVIFKLTESGLATKLQQNINNLLGNISHRPKRLLVLINPVSGRSKGRSVYMKKVAPIFEEAGIQTEVIITEKAHHTEEILQTYEYTSIDGLIVVGGDGIYHEAVNGIMQRLAKDHGLNVDDPEVIFPQIPFRIGLIPCGTGNGIAASVNGNYDVTTAALSVVFGHKMENNVTSVHSGEKLIAYSILLVGYGLWGDIIHTAESRRSQGVLRYPTSMLQHIFVKPIRRMNLTITPLADGEATRKSESHDNETTSTTATTDVNVSETANMTSAARTVDEVVIGSVIFSLSPASAWSVTQPDMSATSMYVNKPVQRLKFFSFMFNLMLQDFESIDAREDVITLSGIGWTVKLKDPSQEGTENGLLEHVVNIDGEVFRIPQSEYKAKLLPQKIWLFSNMPYATKRGGSK